MVVWQIAVVVWVVLLIRKLKFFIPLIAHRARAYALFYVICMFCNWFDGLFACPPDCYWAESEWVGPVFNWERTPHHDTMTTTTIIWTNCQPFWGFSQKNNPETETATTTTMKVGRKKNLRISFSSFRNFSVTEFRCVENFSVTTRFIKWIYNLKTTFLPCCVCVRVAKCCTTLYSLVMCTLKIRTRFVWI